MVTIQHIIRIVLKKLACPGLAKRLVTEQEETAVNSRGTVAIYRLDPYNGAKGNIMTRESQVLHGNYATRRLIAKDVPISEIPKYQKMAEKKGHKAYWFRGRGSRRVASYRALRDGTWKKVLGPDHSYVKNFKKKGLTHRQCTIVLSYLYTKYCQDLPIKYADRVSVYHRS